MPVFVGGCEILAESITPSRSPNTVRPLRALIRDLGLQSSRSRSLRVPVIAVQTSSMAVVRRVVRLNVIGIVDCCSDFETNFDCVYRLFGLLLLMGLLSRIHQTRFEIEIQGWRWASSKPRVLLDYASKRNCSRLGYPEITKSDMTMNKYESDHHKKVLDKL